jgi:hypothetical protein
VEKLGLDTKGFCEVREAKQRAGRCTMREQTP